jgi:hypothetical protein
MIKTKYGKYIIEDTGGRPVSDVRENDEFQKMLPQFASLVAYMDANVIKGGFYAECMWYNKATPARVEPHVHDFDEILAFMGSDPKDVHDLCGEIDLWLGDEKHLLTKSCMVFIPKGLKHCPMIINRVDRPIFHFSLGPGKVYDKTGKKSVT